ncbi:MAG: hypothetical protein HUK02_02000 [Bacteroidaceae bacterium]|nr:hypothetical protein [Bacteroidaceae bacterium]
MDAKESLCAVLDVLLELKTATPKNLVSDVVLGNATQEITDRGWDELDSFGNGDKHDEQHIEAVVDQAIAEKYIKQEGVQLQITPKGKKFLKTPTEFELKDEDEAPDAPSGTEASALSHLVDTIDDGAIVIPEVLEQTSSRSRIQMQLIQAIDRKMALDDFAGQHSLEFEEVLDELEHLIARGRSLDIGYFVDEVLGDECVEELSECFEAVEGDLQLAIDEMGDVYRPEEIRLALIDWKNHR